MKQLKEARKAVKYTQQQLADAVGASRSAVAMWESGKAEPDNQMLVKLSRVLHVSVDALLGEPEPQKPDAIRIPVLGKIPAGIPIEAVEDIIDWEELPAAMAAGGREFFALQVNGDSMYPEYLSGDIVIVRKQDVADTGDDAIVYVNGYDATLKRVVFEGETMTLRPINPQYPPRTFTPEEIRELPVSVAGVVVELRRKKK